MLNWVILIVGFLLLIKGADWFVDGSSSIASVLKIPTIIVGLTIVSFGTSAPEASVSISASLKGLNDIAVSNVVGSNIFNLLSVLGMSALMANLVVPNKIIKFDFPVLIVISIVFSGIIYVGYNISRMEAIVLLLGIIVYVCILVRDALKQRSIMVVSEPKMSVGKSIIFIIIGLACIIFGGDFVVSSSSAIAHNFGLSDKLIGLTIVSIGTSLPELVTSMIASKKGEVDIAIGNVVGSNLFNILFILGLSGTISPMNVDKVMLFDTLFMLLVTIGVFLSAKLTKNIGKIQGIIYLSVFLGYMIYVIGRN